MKNNDRKLLESLISKYGKSNVNLAINKLNENNENIKSGIFIEYYDHLRCDAFRILVLDNGVNVLKNDPLEVEATYTYSGNKYIAKLEPEHGDYITVDYVHSYSNGLCLTKVVKELHAKYPNLPIYCFTEGFYTFRGEYKNVQKFFNDIFSERLKNLSFEFIPGTMGEFLKNNSINESEVDIDDDRYYGGGLPDNYFNDDYVDNDRISKLDIKKLNDIANKIADIANNRSDDTELLFQATECIEKFTAKYKKAINEMAHNKPYVTEDNVERIIGDLRNTYPEVHRTDIRAFFGGWQNGVWEFEPEWFDDIFTWKELISAFDDWLNNESY